MAVDPVAFKSSFPSGLVLEQKCAIHLHGLRLNVIPTLEGSPILRDVRQRNRPQNSLAASLLKGDSSMAQACEIRDLLWCSKGDLEQTSPWERPTLSQVHGANIEFVSGILHVASDGSLKFLKSTLVIPDAFSVFPRVSPCA